jgi:riboflavin kinase / FMN adenylyltransferase
MQTARGHQALASAPPGAVVAIGNFDGVHVGHQRIFAICLAKARAARPGTACVLTFDPHPAKVLAPEMAPPLITTTARKLELIAACGIELCVLESFDRALAARSPADFVDEILVRSLAAREIVVGSDFTYGHGRAGTVETLCADGRFGVTVVDKVTVDGLVASSSKIRELVLEGRVEGAARLLGRPFELGGEVVRGAGRGRAIGIPTANLRTANELLPRSGVYAGFARLASERRRAVINVGTNPTFTTGDALSIEAHVLDYDSELYGRELVLEFVARLRAEARFPNAQALVAQIGHDVEQARDLLAKRG